MTIRTQSHHPSTGAVIPSAGLEANFVELYDLQDGGIDGTNMNLAATFAWTGLHSFDGNLLYLDNTNHRIYEGATATTTIATLNFQHQITVLSAGTDALALISTATGAIGVREARYHNSASPADGDRIWDLGIYGKNDAAADVKYATILAIADDVTSGTEDSHISIQVCSAGTLASYLLVYGDQVNVIPESLTVGTNTNVSSVNGDILGLYVLQTNTDRNVALFENTDSSASSLIFDLYKNSVSPTASDSVTQLRFIGNDSAGNPNTYADIVARITDTTNGSEDGQLDFRVCSSGSVTAFLEAVSTAGAITTTLTGTLAVVGNTNTITSTNTTGDALTLTASSLTTGSALVVYSNSSSSSTRNLVEITNDNTSASAATCLYIQQDAAEPSLVFSHNASGAVISVVQTANSSSDAYGINLDTTNSGSGDSYSILIQGTPNFLFIDTSGLFSESSPPGALTGRIPVKMTSGSTYYIPLYN